MTRDAGTFSDESDGDTLVEEGEEGMVDSDHRHQLETSGKLKVNLHQILG